jgi:hypothetical protein
MNARPSAATIEAPEKRRSTVTAQDDFNRQVRQAVLLTAALLAAFIFGVIVLAGGDWIPGTLIVAASVIGIGRQITVINRLRRQTPPAPPHAGHRRGA